MIDVFETVLIANRGEIACRVIRTLHRLGVRAVAVHTDVDTAARHVGMADAAVRVPSYLDAAAIVAAAMATGADAIHPGYGFLSENAAFAERCATAGIVFVGPSPHVIAVMGDKIRARHAVAARGVPVVPGVAEPGLTDDDLVAAIDRIGVPALIKPSAGGGGKGMHVVRDPAEARAALASARREAAAAFGDDTLFVERYVDRPRHIEVQILADATGATIALGERECSLQRRHQKVVEEAPSPLLDARTRERIQASACETARSVGYLGAGTVEFVVGADRPDDFFFLEMNTRLQVEHPVTELVTGIDLVEQQLRIAAGELLPLAQVDVVLTGHAVEARLYAEDPEHGFLPSGGRVLLAVEPEGEGVRIDSAIVSGGDVPTDYDPLLAKVIATGADRAEALARLRSALASTTVLGLDTNLVFLRRLLADPDVQAGRLDTGLIERRLDDLTAAAAVEDGPAIAALLLVALERRTAPAGAWSALPGFRLGRPAPAVVVFSEPGTTVAVTGPVTDAILRIDDGPQVTAAITLLEHSQARVRTGDRSRTVRWAVDGGTVWLSDGRAIGTFDTARAVSASAVDDGDRELRSPMPGTVVAVEVEDGERVEAGTRVLVVEAMKMEHVVRAASPGIVELRVRAGEQVERGGLLATVHDEEVAS